MVNSPIQMVIFSFQMGKHHQELCAKNWILKNILLNSLEQNQAVWLVSSPFLAAILLFPYNDLILEFNALKDLCQNCIRLANSIFANHESKTWHGKTGKRNKPKNMLTRRSISLIMILLKKKKKMIKNFFPIFLLKKKVIFLMIMMMF